MILPPYLCLESVVVKKKSLRQLVLKVLVFCIVISCLFDWIIEEAKLAISIVLIRSNC